MNGGAILKIVGSLIWGPALLLQSQWDPVQAFSREVSVNNFPQPVTRAASRELTVANATADPMPGNAFSRELSMTNFPEPVVLASSREVSVGTLGLAEPGTNVWSRETSLVNSPAGIVFASSREFTLGQRAESAPAANAWSRDTTLINEFIPISTFVVETGTLVSGDVGSLVEVDANRFVVRATSTRPQSKPDPKRDAMAIRFDFVSQVREPRRIEFQAFGRVNRPGTKLSIEYYDWATSRYVVVMMVSAPESDDGISAKAPSPAGSFVNPSSFVVRARLRVSQPPTQPANGVGGPSKGAFELSLDQAIAIVSP